ncbi:DUF2971 domain-containing protein [Pseudacidovorax sp. NFM-22]|uniref:DUF2971 domain-containing protein n=1 Tax=Pseudacidovorax sp. NFM-22 TaxID=2744469 RepID=UPI001F47F151|nr:DUF2971 domain-containing protein [Pseudacidovorax sp. NFM-22]
MQHNEPRPSSVAKHPARLYKYRAVTTLTIESVVNDVIFFADPRSFNDPLDTKPVVDSDLNTHELKELLSKLVISRSAGAMKAAALSIGYRGPRTLEHIGQRGLSQVKRLLEKIAYHATDPEYGGMEEDAHRRLLARAIQDELLAQYDRGIFSMAERSDCPLMWSHYGDEHRGVCLGFSVPDSVAARLHRVEYGGSRLVAASRVAEMASGDDRARRDVDAAVLARKARDWRYEREWRLVGDKGLADSPLELEDVTFGMRAAPSVRHAIVKALEGREKNIQFFEMCEQPASFKLKRRVFNGGEISVGYPRRALSALEGFEDV